MSSPISATLFFPCTHTLTLPPLPVMHTLSDLLQKSACALLSFLLPLSSLAGADSGQALAVNMFRLLVSQEEGNVVFSPSSAEAVLHMLSEGAGGATRAELQALPYGKQGVASTLSTESAQALFVAEDMALKPRHTQNIYRLSFAGNPQKAAQSINTWCQEKTRGKISELLKPQDITPLTRLVAANAVYLRGSWLHPFDPAHESEFILSGGKVTKTFMMGKTATFAYASGQDWQAVALPYKPQQKGEAAYFIGILPAGDARAYAAGLTPQLLSSIRRQLAQATPARGLVQLPRFEHVTPTYSLKPALMQLGVRRAFDNRAADFSGFADEPLVLEDVKQKCLIKVDEEGTEAAAATAGIISLRSMPRLDFILTFDRPFLWLICDLTTDAPPYFMGLFEKP